MPREVSNDLELCKYNYILKCLGSQYLNELYGKSFFKYNNCFLVCLFWNLTSHILLTHLIGVQNSRVPNNLNFFHSSVQWNFMLKVTNLIVWNLKMPHYTHSGFIAKHTLCFSSLGGCWSIWIRLPECWLKCRLSMSYFFY